MERRREEEAGKKSKKGEEMVRAVEELQHKYLAMKQDLQVRKSHFMVFRGEVRINSRMFYV